MARKKPYTVIGIRRVPCVRCGKPAFYQWSTCAANHTFFALCSGCDIKLNDLVLDFLRVPEAGLLMARYNKRVALELDYAKRL